MITKFNEYYTWNDEVTEKIIDLGKLYDQQEGNPDHIYNILKYELRPQPTKDEYKKMILYTPKTEQPLIGRNDIHHGHFYKEYILDNGEIELYSDAIGFHVNNNGNSSHLDFKDFHDFKIKIKIIKRIYSPEDPYSEEEWEQ